MLRRWPFVTAAVTAAILVVTLIPGRAVPAVGFSGMDLLIHLAVFGAWGAAVGSELRTARVAALIGVGAVFALATELLQIAIPGRAFSWWDLLADIAGVSLGVLLARSVRRKDGAPSAT